MTLHEMVENKKVQFLRYRDGDLWYRTESGFEFPVPISETGTAVFYTEDRAILFMRWIRKHLELLGRAAPFVERKTIVHERGCDLAGGCTCTPRDAYMLDPLDLDAPDGADEFCR